MEDQCMLEDHFSYEEIWAKMLLCDGDRARGPDSFNFKFFREFWHMLRDDMMKMFQEFFVHGKLEKGVECWVHSIDSKEE